MHHGSALPRVTGEWSVAGNREVRGVSGPYESRQQIEQAALGATELMELIQDQKVFAHRAAIARTQKYNGRTRQ
jgi:hypothetical protein